MQTTNFEDVLEGSVREAVTRTLGRDVWKAISFYFNTRVLFKEPDALRAVLDRIFGEVSARVLEKVIADTVVQRVGGIPGASRSLDFLALLRLAKSKFIISGRIFDPVGSR